MLDAILQLTPEEAYELGYTHASTRSWISVDNALPEAEEIYKTDNPTKYWCTIQSNYRMASGYETKQFCAAMTYMQYKYNIPFWSFCGSRENLDYGEQVLAWQPLPPEYIKNITN